MLDLQNYLFLLGGYDLEMLTIRKLLEANDLDFLDAGLDWSNATWKAYTQVDTKDKIHLAISNKKTIVGIELRGACPFNGDHIDIDHHGDRESEPSSIEQVANLLGLELTSEQTLIAANDKGYIPAMVEQGATEDEINKVRKADRKAQGVTEEDERLAKESIEKRLTEYEGITVVNSLTSKFSPIADLLWERESLLICNDKELNYYGVHKEKIVTQFKDFIEQGKAYYGGGNHGFFGLVKGCFSSKEIDKIKNEIIAKLNEHRGRS